MIKKIIACLTICFIITGIISPVFSNASALPQPNWNDPGISEIINISDLTGWMLNGGTFDVSQYTDAESFMNDYFNARTKTRLVSPGEFQEDYYEILPGFGINNQLVAGESFARPLETNRVIASSFRDHTGYGRRLSNEVNEALLSSGHLYDTKIPLLNEIEFANFVGYNHNALRLYSEFFQTSDSSPSPTPNPDPNFSFISNINKIDLNGIDVNNNFLDVNWYNSYLETYLTFQHSISEYTLFSRTGEMIHLNNNTNVINYFDIFNHVLALYLNNNGDGTYSLTFSPASFTKITMDDLANISGNYNIYSLQYNQFNGLWYFSFDYNSIFPSFQTSFAGLSTAINYIYNHFCNINLYVDGELWVLANDNSSSPTITPEFPDAVGGEELPNTTWPISRPRAPYFTSVPGMLRAIEDAIQGDGKLDIDDLKPYLTDANGDPVPDPQFDPEPVPIPVPDPVNPDVVPGLPILPAMPPEMPGFSGVSVLAEIINFTNQSLPTSLIVTFWGIVFGIVILGLIKILHK